MQEIRIGDVAYCQDNKIGLILEKTKILDKGIRRDLWKGISLMENEVGKPWQSLNPSVLLNIQEILLNLGQLGTC